MAEKKKSGLELLADLIRKDKGINTLKKNVQDLAAPTTGTLTEAVTRLIPFAGDAWGIDDTRKEYEAGNKKTAAVMGALNAAGLGGYAHFAPAVAGMFIGKGSKAWDALKYERAVAMEKLGASPEIIHRATGTWRMPDGHWAQEISDAGAVWDGKQSAAPLGKKLSHDKLLQEAYPDLSGTLVNAQPHIRQSEYKAGNDPTTRKGESISIAGDATSPLSDVLHETQHAIQQREGWSKGTSPTVMSDPSIRDPALGVVGMKLNNALTDLRLSDKEKYRELMGKVRGDGEARYSYITSSLGTRDFDHYSTVDSISSIAEELGLEDIAKRAVDYIDAAGPVTPFNDANVIKHDLYSKHLGEELARATEKRAGMTDEERLARAPWLDFDSPLSNVIIKDAEPAPVDVLSHPPLELFNQEAVNAHRQPGHKDRMKTILMNPQTFIDMAKPVDYTSDYSLEKLARIRKAIQEGTPLDDLPLLRYDLPDDAISMIADVTGHEGRHRAKVLQELGYDTMPVELLGRIRWSEQMDPNKFDYHEKFPTRLRGERVSADDPGNSNNIIRFPVTRESGYEQDFKKGGKV